MHCELSVILLAFTEGLLWYRCQADKSLFNIALNKLGEIGIHSSVSNLASGVDQFRAE